MQQILSVSHELLPDAQRQHQQRLSTLVTHYLTAKFQLLHCLAQAEALKQCPASTIQRPANSVSLVRL